MPNQFEISIDGVRVHLGTIGGPEDHIASRQNLTAARDAVAERMKTRVHVTAGAHDVGFAFVARPARSQDIYQLSLRSSEDIHVGSDLPKLSRVSISGPFNPLRRQQHFQPRAHLRLPPQGRRRRNALRKTNSIHGWRNARLCARPVTAADIQPAFEVLPGRPQNRRL